MSISWLCRLWLVIYLKSPFHLFSKVDAKNTKKSVLTAVELFPFKIWQHWETSESWQPFPEKHKKNILGTASHGARPSVESARIISQKFLRKSKAKSLRKCPSNSAGQSPAFWVLGLNWTNFARTLRYGHSLEPFRNIPEQWSRKPGTNWVSFPESSPSWSGVLYLSV